MSDEDQTCPRGQHEYSKFDDDYIFCRKCGDFIETPKPQERLEQQDAQEAPSTPYAPWKWTNPLPLTYPNITYTNNTNQKLPAFDIFFN